VSGYLLYMDDGLMGDYQVVYDGSNKPFVNKFTVQGLTTG